MSSRHQRCKQQTGMHHAKPPVPVIPVKRRSRDEPGSISSQTHKDPGSPAGMTTRVD